MKIVLSITFKEISFQKHFHISQPFYAIIRKAIYYHSWKDFQRSRSQKLKLYPLFKLRIWNYYKVKRENESEIETCLHTEMYITILPFKSSYSIFENFIQSFRETFLNEYSKVLHFLLNDFRPYSFCFLIIFLIEKKKSRSN